MMLAATISLARDARRDRLLIKYGFCTSDFGARAGVLGLVMGGGDKGGDVVRSTRRIIRRFCTKFSHPPRWYSGPEPSFNEDLYLGIPKPLGGEIADTLEKTIFSQKSRTFGNQLFPRLGQVYQHTIKCCGHPGWDLQSQHAFFRSCARSLFDETSSPPVLEGCQKRPFQDSLYALLRVCSPTEP